MDAVTVNFKGAFNSCIRILKAGLVPNLHGSPGVGKSAIAKMVAKHFNLFLIDERLSTSEPTDWKGLPNVKEDGRASYRPFDTIPLDTDQIPINPKTKKPYRGFLLFFDELNSAALATIAAAYKPILDREVGAFKLHPKCLVMAAGNKLTDNAIVSKIGTAMQSRMSHLVLADDPKELIEHAIRSGWDSRVIAFLSFKPGLVNNFDPNHEDLTFACQRTWEFMSKLCKKQKTITHEFLPEFAGTVGTGPAHEFLAFCDYYSKVPTKDQILADPENCPLLDEPGIHYATAGMVSEYIDSSNADAMMKFVNRLEIDMQLIIVRGGCRRDPSLKQHAAVRSWRRENYNEFID